MRVKVGKRVHFVDDSVFIRWLQKGSVPGNIRVASRTFTKGEWVRAGELSAHDGTRRTRFFYDVNRTVEWAVIVLLLLLAGVWAGELFYQGLRDPVKLCRMGALVPGFALSGELWRAATGFLLHSTWAHFISNLVILFFCGRILEKWAGRRNFLRIFFLSALISNIIVTIAGAVIPDWRFRLVVGSSAGILGVLAALTVFLVRHRKLIPSRVLTLYFSLCTAFLFIPFLPIFPVTLFRTTIHGSGIIAGALLALRLEPRFCNEPSPRNSLFDRPKETLLVSIPVVILLVYVTLSAYGAITGFTGQYLLPGRTTLVADAPVPFTLSTQSNWALRRLDDRSLLLKNPISMKLDIRWSVLPDTSGGFEAVFDENIMSTIKKLGSSESAVVLKSPETHRTGNRRWKQGTLKISGSRSRIFHFRTLQIGLLLFDCRLSCHSSEFTLAGENYITGLDSLALIREPSVEELADMLNNEQDRLPGYPIPALRLSALHEFHDDPVSARRVLEDHFNHPSLGPLVRYQWARIAYNERVDTEKARVMLDKAIEIDPVKPEYRILAARFALDADDEVAAVLQLRAVIEYKPAGALLHAEALYLLGLLYAGLSMEDTAREHFSAAMEAAPESGYGRRAGIALEILSSASEDE